MSTVRREDHAPTTAETLDAVLWEYDPSEELRALIYSAERYFEDFPWDGFESRP